MSRTLVFDNGAGGLKAGTAGQLRPSHIMPNCTGKIKGQAQVCPWARTHPYFFVICCSLYKYRCCVRFARSLPLSLSLPCFKFQLKNNPQYVFLSILHGVLHNHPAC